MPRLTPLLAPLAALAVTLPAPAADPPAPDTAGLAFFEQKIRPVLVKECSACHSEEAKKGPKGGLRVDSRDALLKGGDSGPAVVPGKATESLLLKALRGDELAQMPPKEKLPDAVIADFEKWVKMGAPDPRGGKAAAAAVAVINIDEGRKFWSFRPVRPPTPPAVKDAGWAKSDIDRFILARLEAAGLSPAKDADRYTLLRRVTIDLTGLPPTPEAIAAFVGDPAPDDAALAKVVDRLLASPAYGERWGRHWLDVARYADSNGKDENLTFHEAYLYRDYVIRSFNADKPFDRFIREQIAGDHLPAKDQAERDENLVATGFLVVGPKVLADRDQAKRRMDVIDEQIETVGKAFLGLTLGCARCHDHKFDPVPQADYYALAGIFGSTRTLDGIKLGNAVVSGWTLRPLGGAAGEQALAARKEHEKKLKAVADEIKKVKAELAQVQDKASMRVPGKLVGITVDDKEAKFVGAWKDSQFTKPYVGDGYRHDDRAGKGEKSATFTPTLPRAGEYEVLVSYTTGSTRAKAVPITVTFDGGEKTVAVDQTKPPKIDGLFHPVGKFRFKAGAAGSVTIANKGTDGHVIVDAVRFVPVGELEKVPEAAMGVPGEVKEKLAAARERLAKFEADEAGLKKAAPAAPRLAMAVRDEAVIADAKINLRGNPHQLGATVPRGFLQVATPGPMPTLPRTASGRKELADWLADPANPLTARVAVNRAWAHLFGEGIVRTVDNFGVQGERPTHPELLDHLAAKFVAGGWSHKALIRDIVLSRTYRQAAAGSPAAVKADPENKLFGRANRRRVEAEVIRDAVLAVSGKLDPAGGGPVVAHFGERAIDNDSKGGANVDAVTKRSVYLPVIRNDVPPLFEVFDFADPDVSTGKRDATTVPTQALYLMNSPFVLDQAKATAARLAPLADDAARARDLFLRAFGRPATADEVAAAVGFVDEYKRSLAQVGSGRAPKDPAAAAWAAVALSVFGSTEFRFVD